MDAAIGAERETRAQCVPGLGRPHRHRDHLTAGELLELGRLGDRCRIERVEEERHALTAQRFRLRVELDRVGARNLFDETDDLHLWQPNQRCSLSSTTSMATCPPSK